jgi:chromosome segregation ATPase
MSPRAHVTSIDALQDFRASLIVYLSKARPTLEDVSDEVVRTRCWLQSDQRAYWESQMRRRARELAQAQQALFGAKMSNLREATDAEQLAVHRAKRALEEAEVRLKLVKQWSREFDSRVEPLAKQLEHLLNVLATDMPKAAAYLAQAVKSLDAYANITPSSVAPSPAQPTGQNPAGDIGAAQGTANSPPPEAGNPGNPPANSA